MPSGAGRSRPRTPPPHGPSRRGLFPSPAGPYRHGSRPWAGWQLSPAPPCPAGRRAESAERREQHGKRSGGTAGSAPGRERPLRAPQRALTPHRAAPRSAIGAYRSGSPPIAEGLVPARGAGQAGSCSPTAVARNTPPRAAPFVLDLFYFLQRLPSEVEFTAQIKCSVYCKTI